MKHRESTHREDYPEYIESYDEDMYEEAEQRRRHRGKKDIAALRRRAEQRMERKRLKDQLGDYGDFSDYDI